MMDFASLFFRQALRVLGTGHPVRASIGLCLGFAGYGAASFFIHIYGGTTALTALKELGQLPFVAAGVLLAFAPLGLRKPMVPDEWKRVLDTMEQLCDRGGLSLVQRRLAYRDFLKLLLADFKSDLSGPELQTLVVKAVEQVQPPD